MSKLDDLPRVRVEVVEDRTAGARCDEGFLKLRRLSLRNHYEDGERSATYAYDLVEREALDAVCIVLHTSDRRVCLRSAIRPPLAFRPGYKIPVRIASDDNPVFWEVPAGLVEADEHGQAGLRACCVRETLEEVGLVVEAAAFAALGPATVLSPGVIAEKLHYFVAEVDPALATTPTEDGSPVEERAEVRFVALDAAIAACRAGTITDIKTEISLRRLHEHLGGGA